MVGNRWTVMVLLCGLGLSGCEDQGVGVPGPSLAEVAGPWSAEGAFGAMIFTTQTDGATEIMDWLERGASLVLDLRTDGSTGGRLFVPGADEDGGDIDEDLAGLWSLDEGRVALDHEADTFLRDMVLHWDADVLTGERTFGDLTIRLELRRR